MCVCVCVCTVTLRDGHFADVGMTFVTVGHTESGLDADMDTVLVVRIVWLSIPVGFPASTASATTSSSSS